MVRIIIQCCLAICLVFGLTAYATNAPVQQDTKQTSAVNFSPVFVKVSDAMGFVKQGDDVLAKQTLLVAKTHFEQLAITDNQLKTQVLDAFDRAIQMPTAEHLSALSTHLYSLEQKQNPIDYRDKRANFAKKITPVLTNLDKSIQNFDGSSDSLVTIKQNYDIFNRTWVSHERVVRNTDKAHYGKIETTMALLRVAIESSPANQSQMQLYVRELATTIDGYNRGDTLQVATKKVDLAYGVTLLQSALTAIESKDIAGGQAKLGEFIQIWADIEGQVATKNPSLYAQIESQLPVIMANAHQASHQNTLKAMIVDLQSVLASDSYGVMDAMLILLREGLEALLIVMAMLAATKAAKQNTAKNYIYIGVLVGLFASIGVAVLLQFALPAMTSGTQREMIEGVVGIVAVVMMVVVGTWLHSKSSTKAWQAYINKHTTKAMTTGSFVGLFAVSFLSVFREGAETILFYAGILPKIALSDFLLGVGLALVILAVLAVILAKTSQRLPIPTLFWWLTVLIYVLAFKILGVSVHALQLTGVLPMTSLNLPAITMLGIYPTVQGLLVQAVFAVVVLALWLIGRSKHQS